MSVTVEPFGREWTVKVDGKVVQICPTNAEAWRLADRLGGEPINRGEDVSQWIFENANPPGK